MRRKVWKERRENTYRIKRRQRDRRKVDKIGQGKKTSGKGKLRKEKKYV